MLKSEVFPQFGFPTRATRIVCSLSAASLSIILFKDISSSQSSVKMVSYSWFCLMTSLASLSLITSIWSDSLLLNDNLYPSISYSIGSLRGAFNTTVTFLPVMNPISISLFLKLPCPFTFTMTPRSPVFKSDSFIHLSLYAAAGTAMRLCHS